MIVQYDGDYLFSGVIHFQDDAHIFCRESQVSFQLFQF